jgi:hypothetical protein
MRLLRRGHGLAEEEVRVRRLQLGHERQAVALGPGHGQQRAAVEVVLGVGRRPPQGVHAQALGQRPAGHARGVDLAAGGGGGGEVDHHRAAIAGRHAEGIRTRRQHRARAAMRHDLAPVAAQAAAEQDGQAARLGAALHEGPEPARVVDIGQADRCHAVAPGALDGDIGGQPASRSR